jgi:hypothetical protein
MKGKQKERKKGKERGKGRKGKQGRDNFLHLLHRKDDCFSASSRAICGPDTKIKKTQRCQDQTANTTRSDSEDAKIEAQRQ